MSVLVFGDLTHKLTLGLLRLLHLLLPPVPAGWW
jgi:hypothetical protein